jgi:hypothetical protein
MAATREKIHHWLIQAQQEQATHVIIACDTFDWTDYPVSVSQDQQVEEEIHKLQFTEMQKVVEVYSLDLSLEPQLDQIRAWNI